MGKVLKFPVKPDVCDVSEDILGGELADVRRDHRLKEAFLSYQLNLPSA